MAKSYTYFDKMSMAIARIGRDKSAASLWAMESPLIPSYAGETQGGDRPVGRERNDFESIRMSLVFWRWIDVRLGPKKKVQGKGSGTAV